MGVIKNYGNIKNVSSFAGLNTVARYSPLRRISVEDKLSRIPSYVQHREVKRPRVYNPIILYAKRKLLQADLVDLANLAEANDGVKYILIVCDSFTRKCWARGLKDKTTNNVLEKFRQIYEETGPFDRLMTDAGTEFLSGKFKQFLEKRKISFTRGNPHAPHVERLNRTIQNMLFRYMSHNETRKWINILKDCIATYNSRHHRMIQMSPNEAELAENKTALLETVTRYYEKALNKRKKPKFKVKQIVSIQKLRNVFAKGYAQTFTDELFKIKKVHTILPIPTYTLMDYNEEDEITGRFYENELQAANYEVYKVESILKRRTNKGVKEVYVKWKGWPDKFNQWIPETDILEDYESRK